MGQLTFRSTLTEVILFSPVLEAECTQAQILKLKHIHTGQSINRCYLVPMQKQGSEGREADVSDVLQYFGPALLTALAITYIGRDSPLPIEWYF